MQHTPYAVTSPEAEVFIPAEAAREVAGSGSDLRIGLGCETPRVGDRGCFGGMIAQLLAYGPVRMTARHDLPVTVELSAPDAPVPVPLPSCAVVERTARSLRIILPFAEVETPATVVSHTDQHLAGLRFLVADDSATNRLILSEMLIGSGAKVDLATGGAEAIELALSGTYDLLLLDISMPGIEGGEALHAIRTAGCRTPAFAVTANAMAHQVAEYFDAGFDGHLAKPLCYEELVATLVDALR